MYDLIEINNSEILSDLNIQEYYKIINIIPQENKNEKIRFLFLKS